MYANYPLTGTHATLTCAQCHTNNNYTNTPTACYSCHQADFTRPRPIPITCASGFPTDCSICHTTTGWSPSSFDHTNTAFPLDRAHTTVACATCHVNNNYTTLPTTCYGCHQADCNGTNNPNHAAAGFPTTCDTCHTTTSWTGATFNHNNTPFPLTGAHITVACILATSTTSSRGRPRIATPATRPTSPEPRIPTTQRRAGRPPAPPATPRPHGCPQRCLPAITRSSPESRQCQRRLRHLPHQLRGLLGLHVHHCHGSNNAANFNHPNVNGYVYNSVNCYACHKNGGGG